MKTTIYINRHIMAANKKTGSDDPAISLNTYKGVTYCKKIQLKNAVLIQDANNARCSGATIWLEADSKDIVILE